MDWKELNEVVIRAGTQAAPVRDRSARRRIAREVLARECWRTGLKPTPGTFRSMLRDALTIAGLEV